MGRRRDVCGVGLPALVLVLWASQACASGFAQAGSPSGAALPAASAPAAPAPAGPAPSVPAPAAGVAPGHPSLTDAEMETFLKAAKIIRTKGASKGVTGSIRATMSDGTLTHDAHIQTIDEYRREFRSAMGVEFDFRDSWTFNVAGYKLDRLIGLNMVPPSVAGHYRSDDAAFSWWVDDFLMDEGDRVKKKVEAPDRTRWNREMQMMRLFDELIANTDRNLGNMLYSKDWRLWLIDHTRAFRKQTTLRRPSHVTRCDRLVFERLKGLDRDTLKRELGKYLDEGQIKAILARRDAIVAKIESLGPSALFDRDTQQPGTGVARR
jgi:hypothetical protein